MSDRYAQFVELRKTGLTPYASAAQIGVSSGMGYKYERRMERDLGEEAYGRVQTSASRRTRVYLGENVGVVSKATAQQLRARIAELEETVRKLSLPVADAIVGNLLPSDAGGLAEDLVQYRLRRKGFEVFRPTQVTGGTDLLIVSPEGVASRIEVKSTRSDSLVVKVVRSGRASGKNVSVKYGDCKVDFFLLVDLVHENVFVLPKGDLPDSGSLWLTPNTMIWAYRDRYDLLSSPP